MSYYTVLRSRRRGGLAILEVVIVVLVIGLLGWLLWLRFGAASNVLNPILSAVTPPGSVTVDVYGEFVRKPSVLGNTAYRLDFKLIAVPPGTTVSPGLVTPAGVTATPLPTITVTFAPSASVALAGVGAAALTPVTNAQGIASLSVRARAQGTGTVKATITIGGSTGSETATFETDPGTASQ